MRRWRAPRGRWPSASASPTAHRGVNLAGSRLVVQVEDSVWQSQLFAMRNQILARIEQALGQRVVQTLEFKVAIPEAEGAAGTDVRLERRRRRPDRQPGSPQHLQSIAPESRLLTPHDSRAKGQRLKITKTKCVTSPILRTSA